MRPVHRRPPYLDVLVGLTENSAVASARTGMTPLPLNLFTRVWTAADEDPSSGTSLRRSF